MGMITTNRTPRLRSVSLFAAVFALFALAVPAAGAQDFRTPDARDAALGLDRGEATASTESTAARDLRSPDARDAARGLTRNSVIVTSTTVVGSRDLRSPDARDAARGFTRGAVAVAVAPSQDLRSPDSRDAALGYDPAVQTPAPAAASPDSDGFQWESAAIGAGILALLVLTAVGGVATVRRRRGDVGA